MTLKCGVLVYAAPQFTNCMLLGWQATRIRQQQGLEEPTLTHALILFLLQQLPERLLKIDGETKASVREPTSRDDGNTWSGIAGFLQSLIVIVDTTDRQYPDLKFFWR